MIKTITAQTIELDDDILAVEEVLEQLNLSENLMKNTVGIVACHYEFVFSNVYKAICEALPFELVGTISPTSAVAENSASLLFAITVLTSDDVEFDIAITPSLMENPQEVIAETYRSNSRETKPALILTYAPFILQNCGDDYVDALSEVTGDVPCFGTLAVDDTLDFTHCYLLAEGEYHREKMAMVMLYGDLSPNFFVANISEDRIMEKSAVITKSSGALLMEVNERPVIEYFSDLGLLDATETQYAMSTLPFLLDFNDGSPKVSKVFIALSEEKYAICNGRMPEGSTLYMASTDKDDVMLTTGVAMEQILDNIENASLVLIYSCIGRSMTLGSEQFKEIELIDRCLKGKVPFMVAYSGGEICPAQIMDAKAVNRFHNNAFIACIL
ncbi:MAG: FIST C-terminal domain-containing protein [Oscillospiraceae bacterium]|nr:FIST C-terminal domain-containing protein [Oscillospiraceae bacterium]